MGPANKGKLSKLSIFALFFLIAILYTSYRIIPPFIYNNYESDFRDEIGKSLDLSETIESSIDKRRTGLSDGTVTREEHIQLGQQIEASIKEVQLLLKFSRTIVEKQDKVPFLNTKYLMYHRNKKLAFDEYGRLQGALLTKKENDHLFTDTMIMVSDTDAVIYDMKHPDWMHLNLTLLNKSETIKNNADFLKQRLFITPELHAYLIRTADLYSYMFFQSKKVYEENNWDNYDIKKIIALTEARGEFDLNVLMRETWDIGDEIYVKYQNELSLNDDELYKWGNYYYEEGLAFDPLSKLLSRFNKAYPKNLPADNNPTIIPKSTDPEEVT